MPILIPLIIGGAGALGLGAAGGFTVAKGAEKTADALKWAVLGALGIGAVVGVVFIMKKA